MSFPIQQIRLLLEEVQLHLDTAELADTFHETVVELKLACVTLEQAIERTRKAVKEFS